MKTLNKIVFIDTVFNVFYIFVSKYTISIKSERCFNYVETCHIIYISFIYYPNCCFNSFFCFWDINIFSVPILLTFNVISNTSNVIL